MRLEMLIPDHLPSGIDGPGAASGTKRGGGNFAEKLKDAISDVSEAQFSADDRLKALASGKEADLHGTMIALEEADIALRTMVAIRDRLVESYQEIINIQV
jgi:flagellar hook-basal body complex protein FliE